MTASTTSTFSSLLQLSYAGYRASMQVVKEDMRKSPLNLDFDFSNIRWRKKLSAWSLESLNPITLQESLSRGLKISPATNFSEWRGEEGKIKLQREDFMSFKTENAYVKWTVTLWTVA